jgi:hypothetical protein
MSELSQETKDFELTPIELMEGLATNMRAYDELVAQLPEVVGLKDEALISLNDLDIEIADVKQQPQETAYNALIVFLANKRLEAIEDDIKGLESSAFYTDLALRLRGIYTKEYEITALNPEKRIGAFYGTDGNSDLLNYAGRSYQVRKGKVQKINLDPSNGGFINVSRRGLIYQAGPLIDRENNYQPLFEIKDLTKKKH